MINQRNNLVACLCAVLVGAFVCPVVLAKEPVVLAKEKATPPELPKAPEGWVYIAEDVWDEVADTTGRHLHEAQEDFMKQRYDDASLEIRKVAAMLLFDGRKESAIPVKETLMNAVLDLERMADHIDRHEPYSPIVLDHTFARAECALAGYDIASARSEWQGTKRDMLKIGRELDAAATHMDAGFLWAGEEMEQSSVDAVARTMGIALALEGGSYRDGKQIQAAMESMDKNVKKLDKIVNTFSRVEALDATLRKAVPLPPPDGYVLVEDDIWFVNRDEPSKLLHKARADYTSENYISAGNDLREAAAHLRIEGHRARDMEIRSALFSSADELRATALSMEQGEQIPSSQLDGIFARAHYNLARANQKMASDAWAAKNIDRARKALHAAMTNVKQGFVWSGHEMEASAVDFSRHVEALCARLAKNESWSDKEIGEAISFVGLEVNRLGKELQSSATEVGHAAA